MISRKHFSIAACIATPFVLAVFAQQAPKTFWSDPFGTTWKENFMSAKTLNYVRPGLNLAITKIEIPSDLRPEVTLLLTDDKGKPLDRAGIETPGDISISFILARYDGDTRKYTAYTTRNQTSPITGDSEEQASTDRGGQMTDLAIGEVHYKFGLQLPADFPRDMTHSVAIYARRNTEEIAGKNYIANLVEDFRPDGEAIVEMWDATTTATCNNCHDPLALHGGQRQEVKLCVTCHNPQSVDPDTGNSVDMAVMVHKIHMGENLPSVRAGQPYQIIGFRQSVHDYSHVVYPQDIRNCESCHTAEASQGMNHLAHPSRDSCGSCHDDVNWVTGTGHEAGPATDDEACASCHAPVGEFEFDASIAGAHTIPKESSQLEGIVLEIINVANALPGTSPTVTFSVTNNAGNVIPLSGLGSLNFNIAGPTSDYNFRLTESARSATAQDDGTYVYTFAGTLPENASGSFAAGLEANRTVPLVMGEETVNFRETAENPVFYFPIGDSPLEPRRAIVSDAKCESCHNDLDFHGANRHNTDYCVMCHQTQADDSPVRPEDRGPARSIDFKHMIHRIHTGEELTRDYTLFGFRGSENNYNEVLYPGDLRNCNACHVDDSYNIPVPSRLATLDANEFINPIPPNTSACIGCHDTVDASAHAFVNTAPFGEACGACHAEAREFSVGRSHAR